MAPPSSAAAAAVARAAPPVRVTMATAASRPAAPARARAAVGAGRNSAWARPRDAGRCQAAAADGDGGTDIVPGPDTDLDKPPPAEYYSVDTAEFEYMIEMDGEGRMNLANTYIVDKGSGISSRPDVHGQLPAGFRKYIEVPFLDPDTGDSIFLRRPSCQILKCYYVEALTSGDQPEMDCNQVYYFDFEARMLSVVPVEKGQDWDAEDAYLRFLDNGQVILQSSESTPPPGITAERAYFDAVERDAAARKVPNEELMQQLNQDEDKIEFELDIPDVDL
eukprot:jgi/Tetstr1/433891/TSEL_023071.t1